MNAPDRAAGNVLPSELVAGLVRFGAGDPFFAVYLFGSRARGEAWRDSDYDLLVVSQRFEGVKPLERPRLLVDLWPTAPLDLICLGPSEVETARASLGIAGIALREGIRVL